MGFKIIENHRKEVEQRLDDAVERALTAVGTQATNYARANAPVDTGRLRNSITFETLNDEDAVVIGSNVEYAPYQELSTSRMKAANGGKGFLRPAINDHMDEYKNIFTNELQNS